MKEIAANAPLVFDRPIQVACRPSLRTHAGKLLSGNLEGGAAVHAAAFLRQRRIVLERQLLRNRPKLRLIFAHELFHFAWLRLGNSKRKEFSDLLALERKGHARGALGESSAVEKERCQTRPADDAWRSYVCEAFCDTAAWLYAGVSRHTDFRLAARWRFRRRCWFEAAFKEGRLA